MKRVLLSLAAALGLASAHAAPPAPAPAAGAADWSHVTSHEAAEALAARGELARILLFPAEFGGADDAPNTVYVPPGIPEIKDRITATLVRYVEDGVVDNLVVTPEYAGDSVVPKRIVMVATHGGTGARFEPVIEVW